MILDEETRAWAQPWKQLPDKPVVHGEGCCCNECTPQNWKQVDGGWKWIGWDNLVGAR